jgi:hypothetical protein
VKEKIENQGILRTYENMVQFWPLKSP